MVSFSEHREIKTKDFERIIFTHILNSEYGKTSAQIAQELQISRPTVNKYLEVLVQKDRIISHKIGSYTLYTIIERKDSSFFTNLWFAAFSSFFHIAPSSTIDKTILTKIVLFGKETARNMTVDLGNALKEYRNKEPSPLFLEEIINSVKQFFIKYLPWEKKPTIEFVPIFDNMPPMTRILRISDPGLISKGAYLHYYFIGGFIQEKLSELTNQNISFNLIKDLTPADECIYYTIGFVQKYFIDMSIVEHSDKTKTDIFYLDILYQFFNEIVPSTLKRRINNKKQCYEITVKSNQRMEEYFEKFSSTIRNFSAFNQLYSKSITKKEIPYEDWPDEVYLIVDVSTNAGYFFEEILKISKIISSFVGANTHIEKADSVFKWSFKDASDFYITFPFLNPPQDIREQISSMGFNSEYYYEIRKAIRVETEKMIMKRNE